MTVAKLTQAQANQLRGVEVVADNFFNPIQDKHGQWIISLEEVEQCSIEWVKNLPQITYEPIEVTLPI
jgi:hypothetical protein